MKILVTPKSLNSTQPIVAMDDLRAFADTLVFNETGHPLGPTELLPLLADVDGVLAGLDTYDERVLAGAPRLRVVSRYGAGCDNVDLAAASARNIVVTNTPGANAEAVADLAIGLMLSVARRIPLLHRAVQAGEWRVSRGVELYGKTLGIVGAGAIGRAVARRARGFSMRLLCHDPYVGDAAMAEEGMEAMALDELLRRSDVVSLHLPSTPQTFHLVGPGALGLMKPGVILVNTSRGELVDEEAVRGALVEGRLGGFGTDVYSVEPPTAGGLLSFDNVVTTPHTGAHTGEAVARMAELAVRNLIDVLSGHECRNVVNAIHHATLAR